MNEVNFDCQLHFKSDNVDILKFEENFIQFFVYPAGAWRFPEIKK